MDLEAGDVFHGCDARGKTSDGRSFKVVEVIERRSSYSTDDVKIRYLDTDESTSLSKPAIESGIDRGTYRAGRVEDCGQCE